MGRFWISLFDCFRMQSSLLLGGKLCGGGLQSKIVQSVCRLKKFCGVLSLGANKGKLKTLVMDRNLLPPVNTGMNIIDKTKFTKEIEILTLKVASNDVARFLKGLNEGSLFKFPHFKTVFTEAELDLEFAKRAEAPGRFVEKDILQGLKKEKGFREASKDSKKLVLLSHEYVDESDLFEGAGEKERKFLKENTGKYEVVKRKIYLDYNNWSSDQILRSILPLSITEIPGAFETVGHIAHLNLVEEVLPFKNVIGEVLLDRHQHITTVVNKLDSIDTTFRFFKMEVIAGKEDNYIAEVKENGCRFKLDYSRVYWNSRLITEHKRLVNAIGKGSIVCDMFAGVGPFAVPAGKRGLKVYANDLNPESFKYLKINCDLNKVGKNVCAYNMDARSFPKYLFKGENGNGKISPSKEHQIHFIMNLPKTAIEFLDCFDGMFTGLEGLSFKDDLDADQYMPHVHCYCFLSKDSDPKVQAVALIEPVMSFRLSEEKLNAHWVRNVAPKKDMYCISFRLPPEVVFRASESKRCGEPLVKDDSGDKKRKIHEDEQ